MDQEKNMELQLWDYLDGRLTPEEIIRVEELLRNDAAWKKSFLEIREMNAMLNATEMEQPSMRFSKNIMDEIGRYKIAPATESYVNKKIIYGIAAFFLVVIGGFLIYMFTQIDYSAISGIESPVKSPIKLPEMQIDWNKWINSSYVQMFLMVDVVFGLMLLDRFLAKKRKADRESRGLV